MLEAQYRTTLECPGTLAQSWAPAWLSGPTETPEIPAIIEEIESDQSESYFSDVADPADCEPFPRFPDESDADNEFCWSQLPDWDREYLTSPRDYPAPCPWCSGRLHHSPQCDELRAGWEVSIPFGKWKGKPLSQVPSDYLEWLLGNTDSIDAELRDAILRRLSA